MNAQEFTYWLQGFFEVQNPTTLNEEQTLKIKQELEKCFINVTEPVKFVNYLASTISVDEHGHPGIYEDGNKPLSDNNLSKYGDYGYSIMYTC